MNADTVERQRFRIVHNLGWLDRILRFITGGVLLGSGVAMIVLFNRPEWLSAQQQVPAIAYYMPLISIYPFLTAILGWDPFYRLFKIRSCGSGPRNPCGSFPYEMDAALGHEPSPEKDAYHHVGPGHYHRDEMPAKHN